MRTGTKDYAANWTAPDQTVGANDLALIQGYALAPVDADRLYIRRMRLANDRYDRSHERFPVDYLKRFAETLPGKSFLDGHQNDTKGSAKSAVLGRFFKAEIERTPDGATHLVPSFYTLKTPSNQDLRDQIDAGVYGHTSIGFKFDCLLCDVCGKDYWGKECPHQVGKPAEKGMCRTTYGGDLGRAEAVEGSLVYLGCQYDAGFIKSAAVGALATVPPATAKAALIAERDRERRLWPGHTPNPTPEKRMTDLEQALTTKAEALEAAHGAQAKKLLDAQRYLESQAAKVAELEAHTKAAQPWIEDGALYRADLLEELDRLAGILGSEKQLALMEATLQTATAPQIKALVEEYGRRAEEKFPPRPVAVTASTPPPTDTPSPRRFGHAVI